MIENRDRTTARRAVVRRSQRKRQSQIAEKEHRGEELGPTTSGRSMRISLSKTK